MDGRFYLVAAFRFRQMPEGPNLKVGDRSDSWNHSLREENRFYPAFQIRRPRVEERLEITVSDHGKSAQAGISAWWHQKGFQVYSIGSQ